MSAVYTLPGELGASLYGDVTLDPRTTQVVEYGLVMTAAETVFPTEVEGDVFGPDELCPELEAWLRALPVTSQLYAWGGQHPNSHGPGSVSAGYVGGHRFLRMDFGGALSWAVPRAAVPPHLWDDYYRRVH